jgi:hypothetical protein
VDFIKLEGLDADVFAGGTEMLSAHDAPVVASETNVECLAALGFVAFVRPRV